ALDDLGLVPTLRKFAQDFEEKTKIRTHLSIVGREARLPSGMEVAIYRLVQEAFSNCVKHAEASYIHLEVVFLKQDVRITISDNGQGFNVARMETVITKGANFGIMGMRERLELLEGKMDIESSTVTGTKITMDIPLSTKNRGE
ncbi:MAG: histidine kinase, partial [Gorillibacterium sp.]|nr:histidine kinase [Gorillibacterium sp.]